MNGSAPTCVAAASISARLGLQAPECDVLGDGSGEQESLLRDDPELSAQRGLGDVPEVDAVDQDPAVARVVEPREQLGDRRLAGARVADQGDRGPRRDVEVEVVQDVGELAVAEPDVIELDMALDLRKVKCSGAVDHLGLLVEHAEDAVERGGSGEERVVQLRELLNRVEEVGEVQREREQRSHGHAAVHDERTAEPEHDRRRDRGEHVDGREVDAVEHHGLVVRAAVALVDTAKRRLARRLARERLHDPHPGDVLGERCGDDPEPFTDTPVRAVRADAEPGRGQGHQREHGQRCKGEAPVEQEEDDRRSNEEECVLDEARDPVRNEQVESLDVVRDPADGRARAIPLVVTQRQVLEV